MFSYEEFKENLMEETKKFLREDTGLRVGSIWKNNDQKSEVVTIKKEGILVVPTIHLDNLYHLYCVNKDLEECVDIVLDIVQKADFVNQDAKYPNWEEISQNVKPCLVNLAWNQKRIEKYHLVYREFMEFAILFKVPMKNGCDENFYDISYEMLEALGHTQEELYECAMYNLKHQKTRVINMEQIAGECPLGENKTDTVGADLYILTNEKLKFGASSILLEEFLLEFAKEHDSDFVIFPSSVHEVMLYFNRTGNSAEEMRKMVREINEYTVLPEERLSNDVYCFKRETGNVELMK